MNRTRWKMMIGALGLSLGGLAAVAGVPASDGMVSCAGAPPHTVARVSEPPTPPTPRPIELPAPPRIPVLELPPVPSLPALPTPAAPEPIPLPPVIPTPTIPVPLPTPAPVKIERVSPAPPAPTLAPRMVPVPSIAAFAEVSAVPTPEPSPATAPAFPAVPAEGLPKPKPQLHYVVSSDTLPPARVAETAAVPAPATPAEAAKVAERKLKVILAMGDERPRFEVRDGDEVYLKVVCDRVEVKSPGEGGVSVSTMSATGKVTFVTPGGEGTCDQLAVLPGTGQVVVTGKVTFTYNWGKVETTVTGEKMNFRLGSNTVTPTAAQGTTSGVTGVPTSFTRTR